MCSARWSFDRRHMAEDTKFHSTAVHLRDASSAHVFCLEPQFGCGSCVTDNTVDVSFGKREVFLQRDMYGSCHANSLGKSEHEHSSRKSMFSQVGAQWQCATITVMSSAWVDPLNSCTLA